MIKQGMNVMARIFLIFSLTISGEKNRTYLRFQLEVILKLLQSSGLCQAMGEMSNSIFGKHFQNVSLFNQIL